MNKEMLEIKDDVLIKYHGPMYDDGDSPIEVVIPEGVKEINESAFRLANISKVVLPESLEKIGDGAFVLAFNLQEVNFPPKIEYIGSCAFCECKITEANLINVKVINEAAFEYTLLKNIYISDTIEKIEKGAFMGCFDLNIHMSNSALKKVGIESLAGCKNITTQVHGEDKVLSYEDALKLF